MGIYETHWCYVTLGLLLNILREKLVVNSKGLTEKCLSRRRNNNDVHRFGLFAQSIPLPSHKCLKETNFLPWKIISSVCFHQGHEIAWTNRFFFLHRHLESKHNCDDSEVAIRTTFSVSTERRRGRPLSLLLKNYVKEITKMLVSICSTWR